MGEISPQTVNAIRQAMARARAADDAGDKAACEQALAAAPNVSFRNCQSIARASFTNSWFMSMIWSSRERNRSCSPLSRRSRGRVGLSAIEQCLKAQYDALAAPIPSHLAALLKQLETQERG
jgi:hypothetical protein